MTRNTAKASGNAQATHPTTKSHCPAGAGLISSSSAPEGSHTPPQACAARAHDPAFQQASEAQAAQPAEGYKHPEAAPQSLIMGGIEYRVIDWNELSKRGLLERINREVFHPIGLAVFRDPSTGASGGAMVGEFSYSQPYKLNHNHDHSAPTGIDSEGGSHD